MIELKLHSGTYQSYPCDGDLAFYLYHKNDTTSGGTGSTNDNISSSQIPGRTNQRPSLCYFFVHGHSLFGPDYGVLSIWNGRRLFVTIVCLSISSKHIGTLVQGLSRGKRPSIGTKDIWSIYTAWVFHRTACRCDECHKPATCSNITVLVMTIYENSERLDVIDCSTTVWSGFDSGNDHDPTDPRYCSVYVDHYRYWV